MNTCGIQTDLTDAEIAAIIKGATDGTGITPRIEAVSITASCRLTERHPGDCASWQASLIEQPGAAWLRWGNTRTIDWLADCVTAACVLYRGHPGDCLDADDSDPRFA